MTLSLTLALAPSQVTDFAKYPLWTTGLKEIVDQTATGDGKPRWEFKVRNPNPNPPLTLRGDPSLT